MCLGGTLYFRNLESHNLQYNKLGRWVDCLIDQASEGPNFILIDWKLKSGLLAGNLYFCIVIEKWIEKFFAQNFASNHEKK